MDIQSVLLMDSVGGKSVEILKTHGFHVTIRKSLSEESLIAKIPYYDALVVRNKTKVTFNVLKAAKDLKVVASAGAYCKNIDLFAAMHRKIGVINSPTTGEVSMCEFTCGMVLALARRMVEMPNKLLDLHNVLYLGGELNGKNLALIGFSDVGKLVAERMKAFGMTIIGWDPNVPAEKFEDFGMTKMAIDDIWPIADYIVLYTAPFKNSCAFIDFDMVKTCKWGVKIVTVGNIDQINMRDWLKFAHDGLVSGQVGGKAFDLYEENARSVMSKYEVFNHPNVLCTVHLGVETEEAIQRGGQEVAEQLVNLAKPGTFDTKLNIVVPFNTEKTEDREIYKNEHFVI
ncbi:PREDICTED: D-3-phosphoglycerate dehydrogenase-like [Papilio polytes]|uniref:D-3-phosphoglycerate dehydrogenase-like n=1 Tax=Papilio polytes TaxID=76194 RepID=UPI000675D45A|nr:PREDICTED: D-3-phosphoglycerate dehydrogenase-like [Papilio polytes]